MGQAPNGGRKMKGRNMVVTNQLVSLNQANHASLRANANRYAMWYFGATATIPTVVTAFKPYHQRPKERLH
jgi:hypothetical protein